VINPAAPEMSPFHWEGTARAAKAPAEGEKVHQQVPGQLQTVTNDYISDTASDNNCIAQFTIVRQKRACVRTLGADQLPPARASTYCSGRYLRMQCSYDCPECDKVAFTVVERPAILRCLYCGCEWRFAPPPPEAAPERSRG
jgi:hypothetical protein